MKRDHFLKLIGSGGGALLFGGLANLELNIAYTFKKIKIYDNYVKGTNFYKKDFTETPIVLHQTLSLEREPTNIHDNFAIKILCNGKQMGYIPAFENIVLANLLDQGVPLTATVSELQDKPSKDETDTYIMNAIAVQVFAELMVPHSKIISADLTKDRAANAIDAYRQGPIILNKK